MAEIKNVKPIRALKPKRKEGNDEVGVFMLLIAIAIVAVIAAFALKLIDEVMLLVGMLAVLLFVYTKSPPLVVELKEYQRAVILRYGKFLKVAEPGWLFLLPFVDEPHVVDMRVITVDEEFTPQEVITKDNIKIVIDAVIFLKISDPKAAVLNVADPVDAVRAYVTAHLRDVIGGLNLSEVISDVGRINNELLSAINTISHEWGVQVVKVEIQSIELPEAVQKAMHAHKAAEEHKGAVEEEAKAQKARIIAIGEAAGQLNDPAMQYLYLEALKKVAEGRSAKIIFPLELTHLAERLSGKMALPDKEAMKSDLRKAYDEFILEEANEGRSPQDVLAALKKKTVK